ncbi:Protein of unknown function [Pyronema omphalodes CBS 100304]|uniref:Uncharacterized protein n=1 Tax=Pyronema omphalodes (strain CBS 100304) TaxID=1076935 RepID=U4KYQ4_PYROM|nr:Protein of unknown function [Pyronema omphalodes CBS 100304]
MPPIRHLAPCDNINTKVQAACVHVLEGNNNVQMATSRLFHFSSAEIAKIHKRNFYTTTGESSSPLSLSSEATLPSLTPTLRTPYIKITFCKDPESKKSGAKNCKISKQLKRIEKRVVRLEKKIQLYKLRLGFDKGNYTGDVLGEQHESIDEEGIKQIGFFSKILMNAVKKAFMA